MFYLWLGHYFLRGGRSKKGGNAPRATDLSTEIKILCKLPLLYDTEKKYHTDVNSLKRILVSQNDPTRQETVPTACIDVSTTKFYFCELFLVARFSQKFEKPSEKVPTEHFLLCDNSTVGFTIFPYCCLST